MHAGHNPVDSSTYFFGNIGTTPEPSGGEFKVRFMDACVIRGAVISLYADGNIGSAEDVSVYIRLNDTTDTLVQTVGVASSLREFTNRALNIPVAKGEFIEIKEVTPAWATNPTTVRGGGWVYVESA